MKRSGKYLPHGNPLKTPENRNRWRTACLFVLTLAAGCARGPSAGLEEGMWRAVLLTGSGKEIPFNFEVLSDNSDTNHSGGPVLEIVNGENRLRVDEISLKGDSVFIVMPFFDSEFKAEIKNGSLSGSWIKHYGDRDVSMPFHAVHGASYRFMEDPDPPAADVSGRWATYFVRDGDSTFAVGEFDQEGSRLTGTFITSTGDYRFLEGVVSGDRLYLSCFDGGLVYLFTARSAGDSLLTEGEFYSGASGRKTWTARRDPDAKLPDAYSLTFLQEGYDQLEFSYPDLQGRPVSLSDDKYRGKVVVVQFFGSWCPNCMDETRFLSRFYKEHRDEGLEIIGLAYERTTDPRRSREQVMRIVDRFDVEYDMLLTGYTNQQVEESMPSLRNFMAFPTTIILDRKGDVRRIHTGFSGPGTGAHYEAYVDEFTRIISGLLKEKN